MKCEWTNSGVSECEAKGLVELDASGCGFDFHCLVMGWAQWSLGV